MNCREFQRRVGEYVDGALTSGERESVRAHLEECEECRSELAAEGELRLRTAELADSIDPPEALWKEVADSISRDRVVRPGSGGDGQQLPSYRRQRQRWWWLS